MFEDFLPEPVPPEFLTAIGAMTLLWNELEQLQERMIWHTLSLDYANGRIITTHVGNVTRSEILRNLSKKHHNKYISEAIFHFTLMLDRNRVNRNHLLHACVIDINDTGECVYFIRHSAKSKLKTHELPVDLDLFKQVLSDMKSAFSYGCRISLKINPNSPSPSVSHAPLPDKPPMPKSLPWFDFEDPPQH